MKIEIELKIIDPNVLDDNKQESRIELKIEKQANIANDIMPGTSLYIYASGQLRYYYIEMLMNVIVVWK